MNTVLLSIILIPILEIYLFIKIGSQIGALTTILLIFITVVYGFVILKAGFFLSPSLFLFFSYYFLGERRWKWMFLLSFPFVALFMYLLHGLLDIYLRDPFLKMLGIIG